MPESRAAANDNTDSPPLIMPSWSKYRGQAVDAASRRSIVIREPIQDAVADLRTGHLVVDHFYHDGKYWRAFIPVDAVERVCGQAFNFSEIRTRRTSKGIEPICDKYGLPKRKLPILNHVQCRFILSADRPAKLHPLGGEAVGPPAHRINDLVYSLEAVGPHNVFFNLKDCLLGNLISAHRVLSTQEIVFERLVVEDQVLTESPPLPLNQDERRRLLIEAILQSHHAGMRQPYYLLRIFGTNNCTSSAFHILDKVMTYSWPARMGAALYRLPINPRFYLRVRGLDSDPGIRKLVRDEFADFIADPRTQERRKRLNRITERRSE